MKKQIKILRLNKTKVSELSFTNLNEVKGGKSGNVENCPTSPLCFSRPDRDECYIITEGGACSVLIDCNGTI
ncbi:class I lanthipeptide [Kordia sp.]|uniref:class I lanthipeptide n=1 Tax=Kordia sp. TaxID=1965332 RepID=UPI003D6A48B5